MSVLPHEALDRAMRAEPVRDRLVVTPLLEQSQIGPASIDLRLGTHFREVRRLERGAVGSDADVRSVQDHREELIAVPIGRHIWLHPGHFVLGSTLEFIRMPEHLVGQVLGRSSWARLGLIVATSVLVQPGWSGVLTLELSNIGDVPIEVFAGDLIAQLVVWELVHKTDHPYSEGAKYLAPIEPEESRIDVEKGNRERLKAVGERMTAGYRGAHDSGSNGPLPRPPLK